MSQQVGVIDKFRRGYERFLEWVVLVLMGFLAAIVIAGVFFRYAGFPLVWYDEIASIMLAWLTYYGACFAALHRAHIAFPNVVETVRPELRKILLFAREVVVIGFFVLAGWTGWVVVEALEGFHLASVPWLSRQVTQSVIPIGAVLFIIAELLAVRDILRKLPDTADGDSQS